MPDTPDDQARHENGRLIRAFTAGLTAHDLTADELIHARRVLLYWRSATDPVRRRSSPLMWRDALGTLHAQIIVDPAPASVLAQRTLTNLADLHAAGGI